MIFNFNQQTSSKGYLPARACLPVIKKAKFLLRNFAFILICISPRYKTIVLLCVVNCSRFTDYIDFNLSWITQFTFNLF